MCQIVHVGWFVFEPMPRAVRTSRAGAVPNVDCKNTVSDRRRLFLR